MTNNVFRDTRFSLGMSFFALMINIIFFLFLYDHSFYRGIATSGAEVAYTIYSSNALNLNLKRIKYVDEKQKNEDRIVNYSEIDHSFFNGELVPYNIVADTFGYGLLMGLLWKISHSLQFKDMQFLQMFLFSFFMILIHVCGILLFKSICIARICTFLHLFFFPIIFLNVHTLRDIWLYYGLVVLLYLFLSLFCDSLSAFQLWIGALFLAICQFIRPPLFATVCTISLGLIGYIIFTSFERKILYFLLVIWAINIGVCWVPLTLYNKRVHDKRFVGTLGQNLLEGLGEIENSKNLKISDVFIANFIEQECNEKRGTAAFDDAAKNYFFALIKSDPFLYIRAIIHRIPNLIFPGLVWFSYVPSFEGFSLKEKIKQSFFSLHAAADLVGRQIYIRLYLLLGYLGIVLLILRKKYFPLFVVGMIICSCWWLILLHLEHRYLIPYYAFFSFFVGYFIAELSRFKFSFYKLFR